MVHQGGRLLEDAERPEDAAGHAVVADGEVDERPGGLGPVVPVSRHVDLAHAVFFNANGHVGLRE
jgi:hypothetical protein